MAGQIRLVGHMQVPPARWQAVLSALPAHIAATRAEPGCLRFEVTPERAAGRLLVEEVFADRVAFEAHQARAAASPWGEATGDLKRYYQVTEIKP